MNGFSSDTASTPGTSSGSGRWSRERISLCSSTPSVALDGTRRELVLVGPVGWKAQLDGHLEGISQRVRHLGFVPPEDLPTLYAEAGMLCFPSLREGFGLPALEAMAAGTPVIGSSGGAIEEIVGSAGLTVDPTDVESWSDAIERVDADDDLRSQMSEAGRERAAAFTWDRAASAMAEVYHEVAG